MIPTLTTVTTYRTLMMNDRLPSKSCHSIALTDPDGREGGWWDAYDIFKNRYNEMKRRNIQGGDQWFHCMASCEAAKKSGLDNADTIARPKEIFDLLRMRTPFSTSKLKDPIDQANDSLGDMKANRKGFTCAKLGTCEEQCSGYKVYGL